jgi:GTPase
MFVDRVKIYAKAGDGGRGCVSFRREKFVPKGGPDGGNGGDGGNVILKVDPDTNHLSDLLYQPRLMAKNGEPGRGKKQHGRSALPLVLKIPPGTVIRKLPEGELVADLVQIGEEFILCAGGRGGRGNYTFKSSTHQAPREYGPGQPGEQGEFELELKTVADVGLVGYPNAGKSTLISKLTKAHPKVAPYPFTTLRPVIGTIDYPDFSSLRMADIPGLIEGAHENVGLGHDFLRHIVRCRMLLIVLDMAGVDGRDPREDYKQLLKELELYNPEILEKRRIIVANKMDRAESEANLKKFKLKVKGRVVQISAETGEGLEKLRELLHKELIESKQKTAVAK